jgi:hypothetical protein
MDLSDYWQENRRFVLGVAGGALVFLIAYLFLDSAYGGDVVSARRARVAVKNDLAVPHFTRADLGEARDENEALLATAAALRAAVAFEPRPEFVLQDGLGSPQNQYFARVDRVRAEVSVLAARRRMVIQPDGLGIEPLKTTNVETIVRHLEALDLLDRAMRLALDAGIQRVSKIKITLDPGFGTRTGVGSIERTQVQLTFVTEASSVSRFLAATQTERFGKPLTVHDYEVKRVQGKPDEVTADVTLSAIRLHRKVSEDEE